MKIPMGKYKAVNQRTNNTLAEKEQTMIYRTLPRKRDENRATRPH
jgi:hypothetical protein